MPQRKDDMRCWMLYEILFWNHQKDIETIEGRPAPPVGLPWVKEQASLPWLLSRRPYMSVSSKAAVWNSPLMRSRSMRRSATGGWCVAQVLVPTETETCYSAKMRSTEEPSTELLWWEKHSTEGEIAVGLLQFISLKKSCSSAGLSTYVGNTSVMLWWEEPKRIARTLLLKPRWWT